MVEIYKMKDTMKKWTVFLWLKIAIACMGTGSFECMYAMGASKYMQEERPGGISNHHGILVPFDIIPDSVDMGEREYFTHTSFNDLVQKRFVRKEPYIIACVKTFNYGQLSPKFYDAYSLLKHYYGPEFIKKDCFIDYLEDIKEYKQDPKNPSSAVISPILFFALWIGESRFNFIGTHIDLCLNCPNAISPRGCRRFLIPFLKAFDQDTTRLDCIEWLAEVYYEGYQDVEKDGRTHIIVEKNSDRARILFEKLAQQGDDVWQVMQGVLYLGKILFYVDKKYDEAFKYFDLVSKQQENLYARAEAQVYLAEIFLLGLGNVPKNYEFAKVLYKEIQNQSANLIARAFATHRLGEVWYAEGNYSQAFQLFKEVTYNYGNLFGM